ncbi:MAG: ABC transporter substrate-binding protein [Desulfobacterales bacterium]|nr:ABC transporter substrate-binding protein [Desulfobacterales bacterium]
MLVIFRNSLVLICLLLFTVSLPAGRADSPRTVVDSRGVEIQLPAKTQRVVAISDGLVEGVMTVLGVEGKLVGLGSQSLTKTWSYRFEGRDGETVTYVNGMNPVLCINPWLSELPMVARGPAINYETLLSLRPDLVILRLGSCSLPAADDRVQMALKTLDILGLTTVVLEGPYFSGFPNPENISNEIEILGRLFGRAQPAERLSRFIKTQIQEIERRTRQIKTEKKPRVIILGLSSAARKNGAAGQAFGLDTIESYLIEQVVHAKNAFQSPGHFKPVSAEHLLAINPDVIILCTAAGYHPPRELFEAPYYRHLRQLKAVADERVKALPWTPWNCEKRLEYPIDAMVIAKAAYPELFSDIHLGDWLLDFYQGLYGVDEETAKKLRSAQWMDWTVTDEK